MFVFKPSQDAVPGTCQCIGYQQLLMHTVAASCLTHGPMTVADLQAKNYLVSNPGEAESGSRNAVVATQKLCGKAEWAGVSQWRGMVSVTSHKGVERLEAFVCQDWPDHIAK